MIPKDLKYVRVNSVDDLITTVDRQDTPANYAIESIGWRDAKEGMVGIRDFGTKHVFAGLPPSVKVIRDFPMFDKTSQTLYHVAVCQDGSNDLSIWVNDVTAAAYAYNALTASNNWFNLNATSANVVTVTPGVSVSITDAVKDTSPSTVVTVTAAGHGLATGDSAVIADVGGMTELNGTRTITFVDINSFTVALVTTQTYTTGGTVASPTVQHVDLTLQAGSCSANGFQYWIAYNATRSNVAFVVSNTISDPSHILMVSDVTLGSGGLAWQTGDTVTLYHHTAAKYAFTAAGGAYPHVEHLLLEQLAKQNIYYGTAASEDATPTMYTPVQVLKKTAARNYFAYTGPNYRRTLPIDWYLERGGGGLIGDFTETGSVSSPIGVLGTWATGTGTVSAASTATLTGSGTVFTTQLKVGGLIAFGSDIYQVVQIISDTSAVINTATTQSGASFDYDSVAVSVDDGNATDWLKIYYALDSSAVTADQYTKIAITVLYGAQESDPIWRANFKGTAQYPEIFLGLAVNFAKMNKNITGFRIYAACSDSTVNPAFSDWITSDTEYLLHQEVPLDELSDALTSWYAEPWDQQVYHFACNQITRASFNAVLAAGASNLKAELGHAPTWNVRTILTPRFGISTARGGVGIVAVDQDDNTVRLSNYNGDGAHEDDNFPVALTDNSDLRLRYLLQSLGEMIGMEIVNDKIVAIKRSEFETVDFQSGLSAIFKNDTVARRGILNTRVGLFLPGRNGIKLLAADGTGLLTVNPRWANRYDGSERTSDGTLARVTDAARANIIAGYNPIYDEAWFTLVTLDADNTSRNLCYRVSLSKLTWRCREVGCGSTNAVNFFATGTNNTFFIGFGHSAADGAPNRTNNGILKYPNLSTGTNYTSDTVTRFEDSVLYDGSYDNNDTSSSKGITTRLLFQLGNFYSLLKQVIPWSVMVDAWGDAKSSWPSARYEMKFYANDDYPNAFDTKTHPLLSPGFPRKLQPRGQISSMAMEININETTNLHKIKDFEVSLIEIPYLEQLRSGQ